MKIHCVHYDTHIKSNETRKKKIQKRSNTNTNTNATAKQQLEHWCGRGIRFCENVYLKYNQWAKHSLVHDNMLKLFIFFCSSFSTGCCWCFFASFVVVRLSRFAWWWRCLLPSFGFRIFVWHFDTNYKLLANERRRQRHTTTFMPEI